MKMSIILPNKSRKYLLAKYILASFDIFGNEEGTSIQFVVLNIVFSFYFKKSQQVIQNSINND